MTKLTAVFEFIQANWVAIVASVALLLKGSQLLVKVFLLAWPSSPALIELEAGLAALIVDLPTTQLRAKLRRAPAPAGGARGGGSAAAVKGTALDPEKTPPAGLKRVALPLFGAVACCVAAGCAAFQAVVQRTVSCDAQNVQSALPAVESAVVSALSSDGWNVDLDLLAAQQGVELIACAIQAVIGQLEGGTLQVTTSQARVGYDSAGVIPIVVSRGNSWLAVHTK